MLRSNSSAWRRSRRSKHDMISNEQQDVVAGATNKRLAKRAGLSEFDGQRLAVVLRRGRSQIVVRGTATFVRDTTVGNSLRIYLENDEPGAPVFLLSEAEWNGRIVPDFHHGCDFCLVLG